MPQFEVSKRSGFSQSLQTAFLRQKPSLPTVKRTAVLVHSLRCTQHDPPLRCSRRWRQRVVAVSSVKEHGPLPRRSRTRWSPTPHADAWHRPSTAQCWQDSSAACKRPCYPSQTARPPRCGAMTAFLLSVAVIEWLEERISKIACFHLPAVGRAATPRVRLPVASSKLPLGAFRDGAFCHRHAFQFICWDPKGCQHVHNFSLGRFPGFLLLCSCQLTMSNLLSSLCVMGLSCGLPVLFVRNFCSFFLAVFWM